MLVLHTLRLLLIYSFLLYLIKLFLSAPYDKIRVWLLTRDPCFSFYCIFLALKSSAPTSFDNIAFQLVLQELIVKTIEIGVAQSLNCS